MDKNLKLNGASFEKGIFFDKNIGLAYLEKMTGAKLNLEKYFVKSSFKKSEDTFFRYHYVRTNNELSSPLTNLEFSFKNEEEDILLADRKSLNTIFNSLDKKELESFIEDKPDSKFRRKIGFYYESLTGNVLKISPVRKSISYEPLVNESLFLTKPAEFSIKNEKFKILDNGLGKFSGFNPIVRKTPEIERICSTSINDNISEVTNLFSEKIIKNAVKFLYLKETKGSIEIEMERFDENKNAGFLELIKNVPVENELSHKNLLKYFDKILNNSVPSINYRENQNYVGSKVLGIETVDYVPPAPEDVNTMLTDLMDFYTDSKRYLNPTVLASIVSTYFVLIHPFNDGNGRTSRFLIHYCLKNMGVGTNHNVILPVSAYILDNKKEYYDALEEISKKINSKIRYKKFNTDGPFLDIEHIGKNTDFYIKNDYTSFVEYLGNALEKSINEFFKKELEYLETYQKVYDYIDGKINVESKKLSAFTNFFIQGELSLSKRKNRFLEEKLKLPSETVTKMINLAEKALEKDQ